MSDSGCCSDDRYIFPAKRRPKVSGVKRDFSGGKVQEKACRKSKDVNGKKRGCLPTVQFDIVKRERVSLSTKLDEMGDEEIVCKAGTLREAHDMAGTPQTDIVDTHDKNLPSNPIFEVPLQKPFLSAFARYVLIYSKDGNIRNRRFP